MRCERHSRNTATGVVWAELAGAAALSTARRPFALPPVAGQLGELLMRLGTRLAVENKD